MPDSNCRREAGEFLSCTLFQVDAETYDRFIAALYAPPQPNERLKRTMNTPAPWDAK